MRFKNDRQRKAIFARLGHASCSSNVSKFSNSSNCVDFSMLNRPGVSLFPVEVNLSPSLYDNVAVGGTDYIDISQSSTDVPDWVTSSNVPKVQESEVSKPDYDYLEQYGKTVKPDEHSISIGEDKSNIPEQIDDFLLKYAADMEPEKKPIGAIDVDDEYKSGAIELVVESNRNKLKHMDRVFNWKSRTLGAKPVD